MKIISSFLEKYLNRKLKFEIINFIIRAFICLTWLLLILILIEKDAFLKPIIKIKIFDVTYAIIIFIITYLSLKVIIHKNHLFNNSNKKDLAKELIDKIPTKDRIINVLQIYSVLNLNNPYSDLTTKAVNDLEEKINFSDLKKINLKLSPYIVYITIFTIMIPFSLINFSNSYYEASIRLFSKNILFEKPLPFNLKVKPNNSISFKGEDYNLDIIGQGKLPNQIKLFWSNGNNVYNRKLNKNDDTYTYILKNINTETRIWAEYQNDAIMPYNQYTIYSDTVNIRLQTRPKIEDLNITIIPPNYTKINSYQHENTAIKINALKGSKLKLKGTANKKITSANLLFNKDSIINMNINNTNISSDFKIIESDNIAIICYDEENNNSIKIKYSINAINDMNPSIIIDKPINKIKLDEKYLIEILGKISDDFGIEKALLQYHTIKPYYLEQDTNLNEILIFNKIKKNTTDKYFN